MRLCPGHTFELREHPDDQVDGDYVALWVRHRGDQPEPLEGIPGKALVGYQSQVVCLRRDIPFRPRRETPRPRITGWQTAVVTGPPHEEIYTDSHSRVKVQFNWDREGKPDDRCSCWIRVGQAMAGAGYGTVYLPRVGDEVTVSFEEGDPDRPLVTGAVYNGVNTPPLELPKEKTKSTFRTRSSPPSDTMGFSELQFEDQAGQEKVYLRSQKDLTIAVENDKEQTVGGNEKLAVDKDRDRTVEGDQSLTVQGSDTAQVSGNQSLQVAQNRATAVLMNHAEAVSGSQTVKVSGAQVTFVTLAAVETVTLAKILSVGALYAVNVGGVMNEGVIGLKSEEVLGAKVEVVGLKKAEIVKGSRTLNVGSDLNETVNQEQVKVNGADAVELKSSQIEEN